MRKLLSANFSRLWLNKAFWLGAIFMAGAGIILPIIRYMQTKDGGAGPPERLFFGYVLFIAIVSSVFCSIFIGTEYSDGTIRNKLIIGHSRSSVYFSNLITCVIANFMLCTAFIIPALLLLGSFEIGVFITVLMILCSAVLTTALTAIYTLVAMLCSNKTITAIVCILAAFSFVVSGTYIHARLTQPEFYSGYEYTVNGVTSSMKETKNPDYLKGNARKFYEFLLDFTPGGQVVQLLGVYHNRLLEMSLYSAAIIVVTTGAGVLLFRKKDVK